MKIIAGVLAGHTVDPGEPGRVSNAGWALRCPHDDDGDGDCRLCSTPGLHVCLVSIGSASPCFDRCVGAARGRSVVFPEDVEFDSAAEAQEMKDAIAGTSYAEALWRMWELGEDRRYHRKGES